MTAATGAGIWLGMTSVSLAILHVLKPHWGIAAVGLFAAIMLLGATMQRPRPKEKPTARPRASSHTPSPSLHPPKRDFES